MIRPASIKDKSAQEYIEYLEKKIAQYENSPYHKSYVILLDQYNDMIDQLRIKHEMEYDQVQKKEVEVVKGRIDIFGSKNDKEFGLKFFQESFDLLQQLDKFRSKMTPEERRLADEAQKTKNIGIAEKLAMKNNG